MIMSSKFRKQLKNYIDLLYLTNIWTLKTCVNHLTKQQSPQEEIDDKVQLADEPVPEVLLEPLLLARLGEPLLHGGLDGGVHSEWLPLSQVGSLSSSVR